MDSKLMALALDEKEEYSKKLINKVGEMFGDDVAIAFSGGKDSTTLLHLVKSAFSGRIPWKIFTLDTGAEFKEIVTFIEKMAKKWNFNLITLRNDEALKSLEIAKDKTNCCYQLKAVPINNAIKKHGLKALLTAVRWDEQEARSNEEFFTQRSHPDHMRVQPVLHFKEIDIWAYIKKHDIPYCDLYKKGYRSIDCEPCTKQHSSDGPERGGRDQNKEEVMRRLRQLGYF